MPSKKILLIDNDVEYQALITNALEHANYRLNISLDSESGFQLAKKDKPELIIISVELPDSNGYLLCKRFREEDGLKAVPIIIISRDAKPKDFEQHRKLKIRADEYLLKPFSDDVIISKVQNLIGFHITEKEFELMQDHLNSMIQEKIVLDDRINAYERENDTLKSQQQSIQSINNELLASKEKETQLLKQLNENKEHTKVVDKWLTDANDSVERLQKDNEKLTKENALAKIELENVRKQMNDLNTAFNLLQDRVKKNRVEMDKVKGLLNQVMTLLPKE